MVNLTENDVEVLNSIDVVTDKIKINKITQIYSMIFMSIKTLIYSYFGLFKDFLKMFSFQSSKDIKGQLALVTGGGNGLGRELSLQLAKLGVNVAVIDVDSNAAERTTKDVRSLGVKSQAYNVDVTDYKAVERLRIAVEKDLGPVDILVNNAGIVGFMKLNEGSHEDYERIIKTNLTSHFWTVREFMQKMIDRKKGHIVAISSMAGIEAVQGAACYSATNFGVRGFMDSLYEDLLMENQHKNIQLTTVFPYFFDSQKSFVDYLKIKFGSMNLLSVGEVATATIHGIITRKRYVSVPKLFYHLLHLLAILPTELREMLRKVFKPRSILQK